MGWSSGANIFISKYDPKNTEIDNVENLMNPNMTANTNRGFKISGTWLRKKGLLLQTLKRLGKNPYSQTSCKLRLPT